MTVCFIQDCIKMKSCRPCPFKLIKPIKAGFAWTGCGQMYVAFLRCNSNIIITLLFGLYMLRARVVKNQKLKVHFID